MVIKTKKGMFEVIKNIREAYDEEKFNEAYLEEYFDSYDYIVGDIASETIRLKGFSTNPNNQNYFKMIPDYLNESCAYKGAYYILRRIRSESEYQSLYDKYKSKPNPNITKGEYIVKTIDKVPFDKDTLVLSSSEHRDSNIVFDMNKINSVKTFPLPDDLRDEADEMKAREQKNNNKNNFNKNKQNQNNNQNNKNKEQRRPNNNQNKKFSNMNGNQKAFSNNKK